MLFLFLLNISCPLILAVKAVPDSFRLTIFIRLFMALSVMRVTFGAILNIQLAIFKVCVALLAA